MLVEMVLHESNIPPDVASFKLVITITHLCLPPILFLFNLLFLLLLLLFLLLFPYTLLLFLCFFLLTLLSWLNNLLLALLDLLALHLLLDLVEVLDHFDLLVPQRVPEVPVHRQIFFPLVCAHCEVDHDRYCFCHEYYQQKPEPVRVAQRNYEGRGFHGGVGARLLYVEDVAACCGG